MSSSSNFNKTTNLTINQCKVMIQNYYDKINYLKNLSAEEFSKINRDEIVSTLHCLHAGISDINTNKIEIKQKLHKRKLKRLKIKRNKNKIRENLINKRKELHTRIDRNLQNLADETAVVLQKQENIEKIKWKLKQLDKKIETSINTQSIINGLILLRTLRENQCETFDVNPEQNACNQLLALQSQLKNHISNLQEARNLLERTKLDPTIESWYTPDLCEKLFGDRNFKPNPLDRMSANELVEARKYWDQFIVNDYDPDGSYIPNRWVDESDEINSN